VSCPRMVCSTSDDHDKAGTRAEAMMVSEAPERRITSAVTAPDVSSWARKWYALSVSAQAVTSAASNGAPVANTPTPVLNDTVPSKVTYPDARTALWATFADGIRMVPSPEATL